MVLTRDLSRFGRNYITAGYYIATKTGNKFPVSNCSDPLQKLQVSTLVEAAINQRVSS